MTTWHDTPAWPTVTIDSADITTVALGGRRHVFAGENHRRDGIEHVQAQARRLGRDLRVLATDSGGNWQLIATPAGALVDAGQPPLLGRRRRFHL